VATPHSAPARGARVDGDHLAVVVVALVAALAGVVNDFVYDDILLILHDDRLHSLGRLWDIVRAPYWPPPHSPDLYRPVASALLAAQFAFGGGAPMIFRLVSYALYAAAAVMVFRLALRLLSRRVALCVALLFAAHPVHVEAVALGVNQGELIVALLAMLMVLRYLDARARGALSMRDWAALVALYATAALTKETGFVLPGLLVAAELLLVPRGDPRPLRARAADLWMGYALLAVVGGSFVALRAAVLAGNVVGAFTADGLAGLGVAGRALTMLRVVPVWFRLLSFPLHLQIDYSPGELVASTGFGATEAVGLALVAAAVAVTAAAWRRVPVAAFGMLWCAVALLPVSNVLVPTSILASERSLFLPSVGLLLAAGAAASYLSRARWRARQGLESVCAVLVIAGVARSAERQTAFRNAAHFWVVAAHDAPRSGRVRAARDAAAQELVQEFAPVIAQAPQPWQARTQLARMLIVMEEDSLALPQLRLSLAEHANQREAREELAVALLAIGKYAEAKRAKDAEAESGADSLFWHEIDHVADSAMVVAAPAGSVRLLSPP